MRTWIAALGVMLLAMPAAADEAPSLSDYLAAAKKNNPSQRISRADLMNAEAARIEALAAVLPTVNFQANYTYNDRPVQFSFGGPDEIVITAQHQTDASLSGRMPLFDGPALSRYRAARIAARAAGDDARVSEQELLMSVARAYYGAVAAQEVVRAAEQSKAFAEQNAKIVRARVSAGTATALLADRAELELSRDDQVLIDAKRAWLVARRMLASLSGLPEPASVAAPPAESSVPAEEAWQKMALEKRPELASTSRRVDVARLARQASWLQYAPVVSAHGVDRYSNATGFSGRNTVWSVGLTADWQLLEFGQRFGETRKAKAEVMRAEANLESRRVAIADDVHSAWLELDAARSKVDAARHGADVARSAAAETRVRFGAGTATQLEITQSERDLLQAEVDRIRAESDLALARLALAKAAGDEIR